MSRCGRVASSKFIPSVISFTCLDGHGVISASHLQKFWQRSEMPVSPARRLSSLSHGFAGSPIHGIGDGREHISPSKTERHYFPRWIIWRVLHALSFLTSFMGWGVGKSRESVTGVMVKKTWKMQPTAAFVALVSKWAAWCFSVLFAVLLGNSRVNGTIIFDKF